jgi:hypothetical protein
MTRQAVQILSSTKNLGERVFQLAPKPDEQWWREWDRLLRRWLEEVGRLPPDVDISASPSDEIVAVGVTEDNGRGAGPGARRLGACGQSRDGEAVTALIRSAPSNPFRRAGQPD